MKNLQEKTVTRDQALNNITWTHQFGVMRVYRREWKEPGLKKYVVMRMYDGNFLEEFSRFQDAIRWAQKNRKG